MSEPIIPEAVAYWKELERTGLAHEFGAETLVLRSFTEGFTAARARIAELEQHISQSVPDDQHHRETESLKKRIAELEAQVAELKNALDVGQSNCDDIYNDLKRQHNLDKLSWGGRLLEHRRQADELRSLLTAERAAHLETQRALEEVCDRDFSSLLGHHNYSYRCWENKNKATLTAAREAVAKDAATKHPAPTEARKGNNE